MKPKLQDQLAKITRMFEPILELEALLADVDKAEARLVDLKKAIEKTSAEKKSQDAKLQEMTDQVNTKLQLMDEAVAQKKAARDKMMESLDKEMSERLAQHRQNMQVMDDEAKKAESQINILTTKQTELTNEIASQEKRFADATDKLAALKRAL